MIGYIFETTNNKTGEKYLGKNYAVSFDKNFLGTDDKLIVDIEKYGRPSFTVTMIRPFDSIEELDEVFASMNKPVAEVVEAEPVVEEKPTKRRKRKSAED